MKISELVDLRNKFLISQKFNLQTHNATKINEIKNFIGSIDHKGFMTDDALTADNISLLEKQLQSVDSAFDNIIEKLNSTIEVRARPFYIPGLEMENMVKCTPMDAAFIRKHRFIKVNDFIRNRIISRIAMHSTPQHPTLQIGPEEGHWTPYLVAADPLYIVDKEEEFIEATKQQFPEAYQKRMRCYLNGRDGIDLWDLSFLPQNQFSLVFAWNFFDFLQLDLIEKYLENIFNVLAPGGHALFSFNNCDFVNNAVFAEIGFKAWATEKSIVDLCKQKGFNITWLKTKYSNWNYIEIVKPGILKTVKTTQALGEIREIGT